jgi:hypothetical protein
MADQSIQYTEQMVGAGHPTLPDTLNRLAIVEHNDDGTHSKLTRVTDPWVDVRAYGAVGDGVTDDTAAIQAAHDAAGNGDTLFFPNLSFKITGLLTFTKAVNLIGCQGRINTSGGSRLIASNAAGAIKFAGTAGGTNRLRGATMDGLSISYTGAGTALQLDYCVLFIVRNLQIDLNATVNAVGVATTNESWSNRFEFVNVESVGDGGRGWNLSGNGQNVELVHCRGVLAASGVTAPAYGLHNDIENLKVIGGEYGGNAAYATGIYLGSSSGVRGFSCVLDRVQVEACDTGIHIANARYARIINPFIVITTTTCVKLENADYTVVDGWTRMDDPSGGGKAIVIDANTINTQVRGFDADARTDNTAGGTGNIIVSEGNTTDSTLWFKGNMRHKGASAADVARSVRIDGEANDRFTQLMNGNLYWGDGTNAVDVMMHRYGADTLSMNAGDTFRVDGAWNGGMLRLGAYYLWVDTTGDLRIKSGVPASDTDGTVVGTQT